jgi:hypothetical protein
LLFTIFTFEMDNIAHQFENDILRMLGMEGRRITKMVLTFESHQIPIIEVQEVLVSAPDVLVTRIYTVTEVN